MNRHQFAERFNVPRETMERLDVYVSLLQKWSRAINLLGPTDEDDLWQRHISDCGQIADLMPVGTKSWLDLGSGAGLPGLVVAIMSDASESGVRFDLLDSDQRKAAFLREAGRQTRTLVNVIAARTEDAEQSTYDVISARAFAPLRRLLRLARPFTGDHTVLLLHKGRNAAAEIEDACEEWEFTVEAIPSVTDDEGVILRVTGLKGRA